MSREFDAREPAANRLSPARVAALMAAADAASGQLAGAHRIRIKGLSASTGNPTGLVSDDSPAEAGRYVQRALAHMQTISAALGLAPSQPNEFVATPTPQTTSSGAASVYLQQTYKSIAIFQAAQTVNFNPAGGIDETVGTTVTVPADVDARPQLRSADAVLKAAQFVTTPQPDEQGAVDPFGEPLPMPRVDLAGWSPSVLAAFTNRPDQATVLERGPFAEPIKATLMWFPLGEELRLAWQAILTLPEHAGQFRVLVDAIDGRVLFSHQLVQGVAAVGNVYTIDGSTARALTPFPPPLANHGVTAATPLPSGFPYDWVTTSITAGNNATAHLDDDGPAAQAVVANGVLTFNPSDPQGDDQKIVNIFYYVGFAHDFFYLLGFREADGNFQADNFGRGGLASDALDARAYRGAVWATASMTTPADSSAPVMKMGLVTSTNRHTAFDASVVFHEFTHGVTNRLVGGPMNEHALDAPQSGGMGEGWSDYFACAMTGKTVIAAWVVDQAAGIRQFPYDSQFPDHFGELGSGRYTEPHNIGEIWCAALTEMNRRVGAQLGLQLAIDALKLSPANPSFLDSRDAIFKALDHKISDPRQHGQLAAAMWQVFGRFGMGPAAACSGASLSGIVADFSSPAVVAPAPTGGGSRWSRVGAPTDTAPLLSVVTGATAAAGRVDLFVVAADGGIYTIGRSDPPAAWSDWTRIGTARAQVPSTIASVAGIEPGRIDVMCVAADGGVYSAARPDMGAAWLGWTRVGDASDHVPVGTPLSAAVSAAPRVDLFVVAADGGIYTTARPNTAASWGAWTRVGSATDRVPNRSAVIAAGSSAERIDLFVLASDGGIYTTARYTADQEWQPWMRVGATNDRVPAQSIVTAVAAEAARLEVFVVAGDGGIYTSSRSMDTGRWTSWTRVGTAADSFSVGSPIAAVASGSGGLVLFVAGPDGRVYFVTRSDGSSSWNQWATLDAPSGGLSPRSFITTVVSVPGDVDLIVVGRDRGIYDLRQSSR